jgi:uncharacterized protein (TIGR02117 family)
MFLLRGVLGVIFAGAILCFGACASQSRPAGDWACTAPQNNCRSVFVVHDSWHAAIVLRKEHLSGADLPELADFPEARFIEFSWGDKDYFPDPNSGFFKALKAAFWSSGSVLHMVGFNESLAQVYPRAKIIPLSLTAPAFERLSGYLSQIFLRPHGQRRAPASAGLYSHSRFYPSAAKFSALNTCNTWVARALESAGLPIAPTGVISAAQLSDQLDQLNNPRLEAEGF